MSTIGERHTADGSNARLRSSNLVDNTQHSLPGTSIVHAACVGWTVVIQWHTASVVTRSWSNLMLLVLHKPSKTCARHVGLVFVARAKLVATSAAGRHSKLLRPRRAVSKSSVILSVGAVRGGLSVMTLRVVSMLAVSTRAAGSCHQGLASAAKNRHWNPEAPWR